MPAGPIAASPAPSSTRRRRKRSTTSSALRSVTTTPRCGMMRDEPLLRKPAQRLAQRVARHAEGRRELHLAQVRTRRELPSRIISRSARSTCEPVVDRSSARRAASALTRAPEDVGDPLERAPRNACSKPTVMRRWPSLPIIEPGNDEHRGPHADRVGDLLRRQRRRVAREGERGRGRGLLCDELARARRASSGRARRRRGRGPAAARAARCASPARVRARRGTRSAGRRDDGVLVPAPEVVGERLRRDDPADAQAAEPVRLREAVDADGARMRAPERLGLDAVALRAAVDLVGEEPAAARLDQLEDRGARAGAETSCRWGCSG